jgi:hypothetical protein
MLSITILMILPGVLTQLPVVPVSSDVSITVLNTWELAFASDVQDIAWNENTGQMAVRSNGDGVLYLLDGNCSVEGVIELPEGLDGFGVALDSDGLYYVNSGSIPVIYCSDGSDSWTGYPNPAGMQGAGIDIEEFFSTDLYEVTASSPASIWIIDTGTFTGQSYNLPGITDEISGIMAHEIMAGDGLSPGALIVTTRYGCEFFFYYEQSSSYILYDQEDCPPGVEESLGLAWKFNSMNVLWSWKGTDGKYYLSELYIPVFGAVENECKAVSPVERLGILRNPSTSGTILIANLSEAGAVSLEVFDLSGRLVDTLHRGTLPDGESLFGFSAPPGIYFARLVHPLGSESLRFAITE